MNDRSLQIYHLEKARDIYRRLGQRAAEQMSSGTTTYPFITNDNIARVITNDNIARVWDNMGRAYSFLGDFRQSLQCLIHASKDYKTLYKHNKNNKDTKGILEGAILSLRMLGTVYGSLGKHKQAENYSKRSLKVAHLLGDSSHQAYAYYHLGCCYHLVVRSGCKEKIRQRYIHKAQAAFESAVKAIRAPKVDLWTGYASFLIDTVQFTQAYDYLISAIAIEDDAGDLQYVWGDCTTAPHVLQKKLQEEKVVTVRAIDYAFYLLLHHYEAFLRAGITPAQSREAYLTAYTQGIESRAGQLGKERQDALASYFLDSLQNAESMN
jgi:tetratricopeptide (TPR) repeat protein